MTKRTAIVVAFAGALALAGCENVGRNEALGTGIGAGGGALIGGLAGGWQGAVIGGLAGAIVGNIGGRLLDDSERRRAYAAAQDSAARGRPVTWSEGDARGTITPRGPTYNAGGRLCRDFTATTRKSGRTENETITLCRGQDGNWQAV